MTKTAGSPEQHNPDVRFNDGAVDPRGRFFAGTMQWDGRPALGKLFRLDPDRTITQWEKDIFITNGMGWSPDQRTFYLVDTFAPILYAYDYEIETGDIHNRRDFVVFEEGEYPDGMTIDSEGGFWIAMWSAGKVIRLDPSGKHIGEIRLPVTHPTSCCFGGPDLKTLFITTSQLPLSEKEKAEQPLAGRIFVLETDTTGQVEPRFKG
jgi:xylono-1,5-lactonase